MWYIGKVSFVEEKINEKFPVLVEAVSFTDAEAKLTEEFGEKHNFAIRGISREVVDEMKIDTPDGIYCEVHTLDEDEETNKLLTIKWIVEVTENISEVFDILDVPAEDFIKVVQTKIKKIIT
jgi:hypothetical protein